MSVLAMVRSARHTAPVTALDTAVLIRRRILMPILSSCESVRGATVVALHRCPYGEDTRTPTPARVATGPRTANGIAEHADSGAPASRCYVGARGPVGCRVVVVDETGVQPLTARTRDPLGSFSWGRGGAAARELAWSILFDSARDVGLANDWCTDFAAEVISHLPREAFRMTSDDVLSWLHEDRVAGGAACLAGPMQRRW